MESPRSGPLFKALAPALGSTSSSRAAGRRQLDMGKSDGYDKNAPWCVRDPRAFVVPPRLRTPPSIAKTRPHHEDSNGDDDNGYDRRVGSVDARRSGDEMSTFPREVEWEAFPSTILTDRVPPTPRLRRALRPFASPRHRRPAPAIHDAPRQIPVSVSSSVFSAPWARARAWCAWAASSWRSRTR